MSSTASSPGSVRRAVITGGSTFALVTACFGAYAWIAPATYQATAQVRLSEPPSPLPKPIEAAQRLHAALLSPQALEQLSNERAGASSPPSAREAAIKEVRGALDVHTTDARSFDIVYTDPNSERAARLANEFAEHAARTLPSLFAPPASPREDTTELERRRRAEELVEFLAAHPEVTAEPAPRPAPRPTEDNDPSLRAWRNERAALQARLTRIENQLSLPTDNPYSDPASVDPEFPELKRKVAELNARIQVRRNFLAQPAAATSPLATNAVKERWQSLVRAASEANTAPAPAEAPKQVTAQVVARALAPASPLTPDRPRLLVIGLSLGLLGGALAALLRNALAARTQAPHLQFGEEPQGVSIRSEIQSMQNRDDDETGSPRVSADLEREPYPQAMVEEPSSQRRAAVRSASSAPPGSGRPTAVVEVNPPLPAEEPSARETSGIELIEPAGKLPPGRTTQMLGSPIPPTPRAPLGASAIPFQRPSQRATPTSSSTGYSYVSTPPPTRGPSSYPPRSTSESQSSRPSVSSEAPGAPTSRGAPISEPRRISSHPPASSAERGPLAPAPGSDFIVMPHPAPKGWQPDESLSPSSRRNLCDQLYPLAVQQCFVLAVSGVRACAEETARVACELALSLAETGHPRILLLEGNLQRPSIHRLMQIEMPLFAGFSEQLEQRIQAGAERGPWNVLACSASLHVLAEGVMRIPELILSRQFEDCVQELRQYYDVIVIAGPMVTEIAACRAVQDVVDGGVFVCPKGGSSEIPEATALFSQKRFSTVLATG